MCLATGIWGIFTTIVFYHQQLTTQDIIFPSIVGLLTFEFLFRTRKWLNIKSLIIYVIVVTIVSQWVYGILYRNSTMFFSETFNNLFTVFPYNLYSFVDSFIVTAIAYFLIAVYRNETLQIPVNDISSIETTESIAVKVKVRDFTFGFLGWFIFGNFLLFALITSQDRNISDEGMLALMYLPTLFSLIILFIKNKTWTGFGVIAAVIGNIVSWCILMELLKQSVVWGLTIVPAPIGFLIVLVD